MAVRLTGEIHTVMLNSIIYIHNHACVDTVFWLPLLFHFSGILHPPFFLCCSPNPNACVLSRFSCIQLFATPWTVAHQDPLSMGFSSKNTEVGCHALLQEIFLTQGLNPHTSLTSPALIGEFFTTNATSEAQTHNINPHF